MWLGFGVTSLLLVLSLSTVRVSRTEGHGVPNGAQFDLFVLTQAWPPGICADGKVHKHKCHVSNNVTTWTMHGLWPNRNKGEGPTNCSGSQPFDYNKIKSLQPRLDRYWPNVYKDTPHLNLWEHEWQAHGTCATDVSATKDEFSYFNVGLQLNRQYDILAMLANAGIKPTQSGTYYADQFETAVQKATGFKPRLQCACNTQTDDASNQLIFQVEICMDFNFKPITCPQPNHDIIGTARNNKVDKSCRYCTKFAYPPIKHF